MARWPPALAAAVLLASQVPAASAQNLLTNPDFDTSLNGWMASSIASWDGTLDAGGSPTSGSAKGVFDAPTETGNYDVVSQCVPLTIGVTYHLGGDIYISPGQTASASAYFLLVPFPTADCSGPPPPQGPFVTTPPVTAAGTWTVSSTNFSNSFAQSGLFAAYLSPTTGGRFQANFDDVVVAPGAVGCTPGPTTLCFLGSRFSVMAIFKNGTGSASGAGAVELGESGYFWFFDPANMEVSAKMIDGCGLGGHFWFFAAGLTNLNVVIVVTDVQTGAVRTYTNPANAAFQPILDTSAFACP